MKVLLAIDDSKFSETVLKTVIAQNRPQDTQLLVVHVTEPVAFLYPAQMAPEYMPSPALDEMNKEHLKQAQALVACAAEKLRSAGFQAQTAVREGDVRAELIDLATEWHADLIVVGSHGRRGLDRFLIGSVSEYVARHAPCSVEIARPPATQ